jgi:hypothetical protein
MLLLILSAIYVFSGLSVNLLLYKKKGIRNTWLISTGITLVAWLTLAFIPRNTSISWTDLAWMPIGSTPIQFTLDAISWPICAALGAILMAFQLTETTRLHMTDYSRIWAGVLALGGIGILAISATTPLSLVLIWSALDLVEFVFLLSLIRETHEPQKFIRTYAFRVVGTLLLLSGMIINQQRSPLILFESIIPEAGFLLFMAAIFRLGVFSPISKILIKDKLPQPLIIIVMLLSAATGLVMIARLSGYIVSSGMSLFIGIVASILALFSAYQWASAKNETDGLRFWIFSFAALAVISSLQGSPVSVVSWGTAMMLSGAILPFYSFRKKWLSLVLLLSFLSITILPFTPLIVGLNGIATTSNLWILTVILTMALLQFGFLKYLFQERESLEKLDQWVKVIFIAGLFVLLVTHWWIFIKVFPTVQSDLINLNGIPAFIVGVLLFLMHKGILPHKLFTKPLGVIKTRIQRANSIIEKFLSSKWLRGLPGMIFHGLGSIVDNLTFVFEGAGGILWAILLLTLLISAIQANLAP